MYLVSSTFDHIFQVSSLALNTDLSSFLKVAHNFAASFWRNFALYTSISFVSWPYDTDILLTYMSIHPCNENDFEHLQPSLSSGTYTRNSFQPKWNEENWPNFQHNFKTTYKRSTFKSLKSYNLLTVVSRHKKLTK